MATGEAVRRDFLLLDEFSAWYPRPPLFIPYAMPPGVDCLPDIFACTAPDGDTVIVTGEKIQPKDIVWRVGVDPVARRLPHNFYDANTWLYVVYSQCVADKPINDAVTAAVGFPVRGSAVFTATLPDEVDLVRTGV